MGMVDHARDVSVLLMTALDTQDFSE
jgi:hypothetical protein